MNNARGKSSGKRTRTTSNKSNESLIQNVTSKVSGFFPLTISKWFGSPAQDNSANGGSTMFRKPFSESTDSSSDDEEFIVSQPPVKKLRTDFQSFVSQKYNQGTTLEKNGKTERRVVDTINNTEDFMESLPGPSSNYKRDAGLISTPVPSFENKSDAVKLNTQFFVNSKRSPQIASMAAANKVRILSTEDTRNNSSSMSSDFTPKLFHSDSKNAMPTTSLRESSESVKKTPYVSPKKPTFKAAILGSPFYPGRTMYGGASAYNIIQIPNEPSFYQRRKPIVKPPPASSDNYMSQTAKRILDLLEDYSSPISEAKRIPYIGHMQNDSCKNNLSIGENSSAGSSILKTLQANRTQEMRIPQIPALLKMRRRARLMDSTQAARQIAASQSSSISMLPYANKYESRPNTDITDAKYKSKIVNKRTRLNRKNEVEIECQPVVNLPAAVLSIDNSNLPKFSPILKSYPSVEKQEKTKPRDGFSFSTPIKVTDVDSVRPVHPLNNFTFSSPMKVDINGNKNSKEVPSKHNALNFRYDEPSIENTAVKPKTQCAPTANSWGDKFKKTGVWSCSACWVENKLDSQKCIACDSPKPGSNSAKEQWQSLYTPKKDGDCGKDKVLPKSDAVSKTADSSSWGSSFVQKGNWQCKECWVSNKQNENKCVACGESKPGADSKQSVNKLKSSWGEKFKNADGWKCKDCWVPNKKEDAKCVACGAIQPNAEVKATDPWGDKFKSDGNWQCPDCWVSNKSDVKSCVACGADNPKLSIEPVKPLNTDMKLPVNDSGFADIIKKQKEQWACSGCFTRNEFNRLKCVCCEQPKPGEKSEEKSSSVTFDFNKTQTPQFKFGIQNDTKPVENNNDKNTIVSSLVSDKADEKKPGSQSGFTFGIQAVEKPKTDGFSFGIPISVAKAAETKEDAPKSEASVSISLNAPVATSKPELPKFDTFKAPISLAATDVKTVDQPKIDKNASPADVPKFTFKAPNTTEEKKDIATPSAGYASFSTLSTSAPTFSFGLNTVTNKSASSTDKQFSFGTTTSPAPSLEKPQSTASVNPPSTVGVTLSTVPQIPLVSSAPVTTSVNIFANSVLTNNSNVVNCTPEKENTEKSPILGTEIFSSTTSSLVNTPQKPVFSFGNNPEPVAPKAAGGFPFLFGSANASPAPTFNMPTSLPAAPAVFRSLPENVSSGLGITKPTLPSTGLFGAPTGENVFGAAPTNVQATPIATSANVFGGSAIPSFNKTPATTTSNYFGSQQAAPTFNSSSTTPVFGSSSITPVPAANNMFGMPAQNQATTTNNQPSMMFGSPVQNAVTPAVFGSAAPSVNSNLGIFGNSAVPPAFGASTPVAFGDPANAAQPQAVPAFNFGSAASPAAPVFGFGQQQASPSVPVYNFGTPGGPQGLQFNMGTCTGTSQPSPARIAARPIRKAIRRKQVN